MDRRLKYKFTSLSTFAIVLGVCATPSFGVQNRVWEWGADYRIGGHSPSPILKIGLTNVSAVCASMALKSDGTVWRWGIAYHTPTQYVNNAAPTRLPHLTGVKTISQSPTHGMAITTDGFVWAWGKNTAGLLGDGTTLERFVPVRVLDLSSVTAISAGGLHSLALKSDGTVWAWGNNIHGALGTGASDLVSHPRPAQVPGLTNIVAIAAGRTMSIALKADGTVWTWGDNARGQVGHGALNAIQGAGQLPSLMNVRAISAGDAHGAALKTDGTVWSWGDNRQGALGIGATNNDPNPTPAQAVGLTDVAEISSGGSRTVLRKTDGEVLVCGQNPTGAGFDILSTPAPVKGLPKMRALSGGGATLAIGSGYTVTWQHTPDGYINIWDMNDKTLVGWKRVPYRLPLPWRIVGTPDLDGDGKPDILTHNAEKGMLCYWLMDGVKMRLIGTIHNSIPKPWSVVGLGDMFGNGKTTVLWRNADNGDLSYWTLEGTRVGRTGYLRRKIPAEWQVSGMADLNGDGKEDILWRHKPSGAVLYWLMNGTDIIGNGVIAWSLPSYWDIVGSADVDDNGKTDILLFNKNTGDFGFWRMDGVRSLGSELAARPVPITWRVVGAK